MKRKVYIFINILFYLLTLSVLAFNNPFESSVINENNIFILLITFLCIHIFKCIKQYFMLIESDIHIRQFIPIYVKSTFCSIILPYKIGELYKSYLYGYKIDNYMKGFLTIVVDKFFEAIVLLSILIPYTLKNNEPIKTIIWLLAVFVILFLVIYLGFKSTYYYLNKHFVLHRKSKQTIFILNFLEKCNNIYEYISNLIKGRVLIILMLTILSWLFEWIFVNTLQISSFADYTNSFFFGMPSYVVSNYIIVAIIVFICTECLVVFKSRSDN